MLWRKKWKMHEVLSGLQWWLKNWLQHDTKKSICPVLKNSKKIGPNIVQFETQHHIAGLRLVVCFAATINNLSFIIIIIFIIKSSRNKLHFVLTSFSVRLCAMELKRFEVSEYDYDSSYSDSESDSENDSSSSESRPTLKRKRCGSPSEGSAKCKEERSQPALHMGLSQLYMIDEGDGCDSHFAENGKDPKRVRKAMQEPCCKAKCKRALPFKLVMRVLVICWGLPKASQDCVLWAMQQKAGGNQENDQEVEDDSGSSGSSSSESSSGKWHHKISWSIEGSHTAVCNIL